MTTGNLTDEELILISDALGNLTKEELILIADALSFLDPLDTEGNTDDRLEGLCSHLEHKCRSLAGK